MSQENISKLMIGTVLVCAAALAGTLLVSPSAPPQERGIKLTARQHAYDPPVLRVSQGDTIGLRIESADVVHVFFYLEGYEIDAKVVPESPYLHLTEPSHPHERIKKVAEVVFAANRTGKFRYHCSHTCGTMHPFMGSGLVLAPNRRRGRHTDRGRADDKKVNLEWPIPRFKSRA